MGQQHFSASAAGILDFRISGFRCEAKNSRTEDVEQVKRGLNIAACCIPHAALNP